MENHHPPPIEAYIEILNYILQLEELTAIDGDRSSTVLLLLFTDHELLTGFMPEDVNSSLRH